MTPLVIVLALVASKPAMVVPVAPDSPSTRCFRVLYHPLGRFLRDFSPGHTWLLGPEDTVGVKKPLRDSMLVADSVGFGWVFWSSSFRLTPVSDSVELLDGNGFESWHYSFRIRADSIFGTAHYLVDSDPLHFLVARAAGVEVPCW